MRTELQIQGMSCQHCVKAVDGALRAMAGVEDVEVAVGRAVLSTPNPVNLEQVRSILDDLGFELV
ncbi:MAG: heavy metal-associated domain-containing protein [Coriobacteriia bacterium]|jgi:copper chaperone|nr:heavy metal-associated domain-containing protein [Coriobacteriia bacterium]